MVQSKSIDQYVSHYFLTTRWWYKQVKEKEEGTKYKDTQVARDKST